MVNLVDWEIGHVSGGVEAWLERSAYGTETIPVDTVEERVRFDLDAAPWTALGSETVLDVAKHTVGDGQR